MRVGVLIKQVPSGESLTLGPDGRLVRDGRALEINAYCRRAVAKGVELAEQSQGSCTVISLGPPSAVDALREALAWGADEGVLITDPVLAGSDTLVTARALAAALRLLGPFDLILAGRNSIDADTGQVGPEVAELLDLPFLAGVKVLTLTPATAGPATVRAHLELDDGWADAEVDLPALLTCAERLCPPAKVDRQQWSAISPSRVRLLCAADLGPGPWGAAGSPTRVGAVRALAVTRGRVVLDGPLGDQVAQAVARLRDAGALAGKREAEEGQVPDGWAKGGKGIAVVLQPDRPLMARQLLGAAARMAQVVHATVHAVAAGAPTALPGRGLDPDDLGSWGADAVVAIDGAEIEEDLARAVAAWASQGPLWAVLAPGTLFGREVASRVAARLGVGLTGDAIDLEVSGGRVLSWKPAFGGQLVAAITSSSPVQLVTIRAGVLPTPNPRPPRRVPVQEITVRPTGRVRVSAWGRDDDLDALATAAAVVGVGAGVDPAEYGRLTPLLVALDAQLAATRKATDQGWQPRSRQVGLTGRSLAPLLYVAIGLSGRFNHLVGVRGAGMILAINTDPSAPVFAHADLGIVGDWRQVVPLLAAAVADEGYEGCDDVSR